MPCGGSQATTGCEQAWGTACMLSQELELAACHFISSLQGSALEGSPHGKLASCIWQVSRKRLAPGAYMQLPWESALAWA